MQINKTSLKSKKMLIHGTSRQAPRASSLQSQIKNKSSQSKGDCKDGSYKRHHRSKIILGACQLLSIVHQEFFSRVTPTRHAEKERGSICMVERARKSLQ